MGERRAGGWLIDPVSGTPSKAVFLSYASQDAAAAKGICDALRAKGVEVWFDADGGLEHGDEWDVKIRRQIKECVLFIPIISANTQAREEGYFRIEWDVAAERARGIASGVAFILPVVIDGTREPDALVPDRFRMVQWTRLPGGAVSPEVLARFLKLWSHRAGVLKHASEAGSAPASESSPTAAPASRRFGLVLGLIAVAVAIVILALGLFFSSRPRRSPEEVAKMLATVETLADKATKVVTAIKAPEPSSAVAKAHALLEQLESTRDDFALAEDLLKQAVAKDPADAEAWAAYSQLHSRYISRGWDVSSGRRDLTVSAARRALQLDPKSFEARVAQAGIQGNGPRELAEAERNWKALHRERPDDQRVMRAIAAVLRREGRHDEAAAMWDKSAALPGGDPLALYSKSLDRLFTGRAELAEADLQASLAQKPFSSSLLLAAWYRIAFHGDLDGAQALIDRVPISAMREDRPCYIAYFLYAMRRDCDGALKQLDFVQRDWFEDNWYSGPKSLLAGDVLAVAGRREAAQAQWRDALQLTESRLAGDAKNAALYRIQAYLLARLGETAAAEEKFKLCLQMNGVDLTKDVAPFNLTRVVLALGRNDEAIELIRRGQQEPSVNRDYAPDLLRLDPSYDSLRSNAQFQKLAGLNQTVVPAAPEKSVAVLAFANLSDDRENEYFSDGISEELLNVLAKVPGLKVTARTSAFYFKGKDVPIPEIAQKLGVAYVVEGSVRKQGTKVRITAQLIKADAGFHVWSDTFTRELKDVFAVQDEIAGLISKNLQVTMGMAAASARRQVNPEAHRLLLEGRYFFNARTTEGFARAEASLNQAIALDPDFAEAHAGLADVLATKGIYEAYAGANLTLSPAARLPAQRAQSLDPKLAEAYPAMAMILVQEGRFGEAVQEFQKAFALNPNYALAHHWYALELELEGRLDAALGEIEQAIQLDPLSVSAVSTRERFLAYAGRYAEALAADDKVRTLRPDFGSTGGFRTQSLLALGRKDEALAQIRVIEGDQNQQPHWMVDASAIRVLRQMGRDADATAYAVKVLPRLPEGSWLRGTVLASLGRWEEAAPLLERTPTALQAIYYWNPVWDEWRSDPRFMQLLAKLGRTEEYKVARETLTRLQRTLPKGTTSQ